MDNSKKTIAAFLSTMTTPFHKNISLGFMDCAKLHNYNAIIYSGIPLHANRGYSEFRENIFLRIQEDQISGIVIPSSSMARYVSKKEFKDFLKRYNNFPIVTIAGEDEDYINVQPNYRLGMKKLIDHLIEVHNFKKIVLLRGPENNNSSNSRQTGYEESLKEHGIGIDKKLIISRDISANVSDGVVNDLLNEQIEFDAIVTVNDNVAFATIEALKKHKIRVPEDKAVCGNQGRFEGVYFDPPLTTCDEDSYKQGWIAAESLMKVIENQKINSEIRFDTNLFIRRSCGCNGDSSNEIQLPNDIEINNDNLHELVNLLDNTNLNKRETTEKILELQSRNTRVHKDKIIELFRMISSTISLSGDIVKSIGFMAKFIGLKHCYVMTYENYDIKQGQVLFQNAFVDQELVTIDENDKILDKITLIPPKYLPKEENYSLLVEPLYFREVGIGYVIFDYCYRDGAIFESIKGLLASHIYSEYHFQQSKLANERILSIASSISEWLWETDENMNFTFTSEGSLKVIGYGSGEIIGKSLFTFFHPDEKENIEMIKNRYITQKKDIRDVRCWNLSKEGYKRALLMMAVPIVNDRKELMGYRGAFKDVTEQLF
ncbi:MAG: substrate-binding domain-containing protein [Spirochaetales bacterium]|nr:substrate-binding domain-containing protein [Spirochaetales bacterium]